MIQDNRENCEKLLNFRYKHHFRSLLNGNHLKLIPSPITYKLWFGWTIEENKIIGEIETWNKDGKMYLSIKDDSYWSKDKEKAAKFVQDQIDIIAKDGESLGYDVIICSDTRTF